MRAERRGGDDGKQRAPPVQPPDGAIELRGGLHAVDQSRQEDERETGGQRAKGGARSNHDAGEAGIDAACQRNGDAPPEQQDGCAEQEFPQADD